MSALGAVKLDARPGPHREQRRFRGIAAKVRRASVVVDSRGADARWRLRLWEAQGLFPRCALTDGLAGLVLARDREPPIPGPGGLTAPNVTLDGARSGGDAMEVTELIRRLANVIDHFRAVDDPRRLWGETGGQQLQLWLYPDQESELDAIGVALSKENDMLSVEETVRRLTYDAVVPSVHQSFGSRDVESVGASEAIVAELLAFERFTVIELPILYLAAPEPIEIDGVRFERLDQEHFAKSAFGKWIYGIYDGRLTARARVKSPGDDWKHLTNAVDFIDSALRLLSGAVFPWQIEQGVVPAIAGSGPQPGATPYRTPSEYAETEWSGSFGSLHRPGGTLHPAKKIGELWGDDAEDISKFLNAPRKSQTEKRLYTAFRWLGEACRSHDRPGQFVAAVTALEALLSIRNDDQRSSAGVTGLLAERAAYFAGPADNRIATHKEVTRLYGLRSELVHGRASGVSRTDVAAAGQLAWQVARELFRRRNELDTDEAVTQWSLTERYRA